MELELRGSIAALEAELASLGHPLGDPARRPLGRAADELQATAVELLGYELPLELVEYWGWCAGTSRGVAYPEGAEELGLLDLLLPGWVDFPDFENALSSTREYNETMAANDLMLPGFETWLEFATVHNSRSFHAEIASEGGGDVVPVSVYEIFTFPTEEPSGRFASLAEFVDAMTMLVRDGYWTRNKGGGWSFDVDRAVLGDFWTW